MTSTRNILMSSIFVFCVISLTLAGPTNTCLLQCVREVLKCQRSDNFGFLSQIECCDKYTMCYFLCLPDAITAPSCSSKIKRGSWNKREVVRGGWRNTDNLGDLSDDLAEDNQFYL